MSPFPRRHTAYVGAWGCRQSRPRPSPVAGASRVTAGPSTPPASETLRGEAKGWLSVNVPSTRAVSGRSGRAAGGAAPLTAFGRAWAPFSARLTVSLFCFPWRQPHGAGTRRRSAVSGGERERESSGMVLRWTNEAKASPGNAPRRGDAPHTKSRERCRAPGSALASSRSGSVC